MPARARSARPTTTPTPMPKRARHPRRHRPQQESRHRRRRCVSSTGLSGRACGQAPSGSRTPRCCEESLAPVRRSALTVCAASPLPRSSALACDVICAIPIVCRAHELRVRSRQSSGLTSACKARWGLFHVLRDAWCGGRLRLRSFTLVDGCVSCLSDD